MASKILTFDQALKQVGDSKKNLLLGNGFSMAYDRDIFNYGSLYKTAEDSISKEMPEVSALFKKLKKWDFEAIIRMLQNGADILPVYLPGEQDIVKKILKHSDRLKNVLIDTIAKNHPDKPNSIPLEKFTFCRRFLSHFLGKHNDGRVYTLNYDLLIYWALLNKDADGKSLLDLSINDGFGKEEPDSDYITWQNEGHTKDQRIFYLHGALHLFDLGVELEKYTWINKGVSLLEQIRESLQNEKFPLFVAEGDSQTKLNKIKHQAYLHHCYKSFLKMAGTIQHSLFIFGHSLDENDRHFIDRIAKGKISRVFIGIYLKDGKTGIERVKKIGKNLEKCRNEDYPLTVDFFDAESAKVWG